MSKLEILEKIITSNITDFAIRFADEDDEFLYLCHKSYKGFEIKYQCSIYIKDGSTYSLRRNYVFDDITAIYEELFNLMKQFIEGRIVIFEVKPASELKFEIKG